MSVKDVLKEKLEGSKDVTLKELAPMQIQTNRRTKDFRKRVLSKMF